MKEYHKYVYDGPVMSFDRLIVDRWCGETVAQSKKKAKSNLMYQFKKYNNRIAGTKIIFPADVRMKD